MSSCALYFKSRRFLKSGITDNMSRTLIFERDSISILHSRIISCRWQSTLPPTKSFSEAIVNSTKQFSLSTSWSRRTDRRSRKRRQTTSMRNAHIRTGCGASGDRRGAMDSHLLNCYLLRGAHGAPGKANFAQSCRRGC